MILDLGSACKRLISCSHSRQQIVQLLEEIFTSKEEVKRIGFLRGDDAQTFIDTLDQVRSVPFITEAGSDCSLSIPLLCFRTFILQKLGLGFPKFPTTVPDQVFERVVQAMRSQGFASEIITDPNLLQSIGNPAIPRRVRRRLEG